MNAKEKLINRAKSSSNWKHLSKVIKEENSNNKRKFKYENKDKKNKKIKKDRNVINKDTKKSSTKEVDSKKENKDLKTLLESEELKNTANRDIKILDSILKEENKKEINMDDIYEMNEKNKDENKYLLIEGTKNSNKRIGKYLAIDCEMVGVGPEGKESVLARVSIVNFYGHLVLDKYVLPREKVTDYRTKVSGITKEILRDAQPFLQVQKEVADLLKDKIIVGHAIHHDFQALLLDHPYKLIRDTSLYKPFRKITNGRTPSLKKLSKVLLGIDVQGGEHSSVEDAQATMLLYRKYRKEWENTIKKRNINEERSLLSVTSNN